MVAECINLSQRVHDTDHGAKFHAHRTSHLTKQTEWRQRVWK
jgi:hypothetical protein